jgi:1-acyl-sn-glycerol-3-phosphate acyltransferase
MKNSELPIINYHYSFMLYRLLKIIVRTARPLFCRRIYINKPELLKEKGPLLLACNHPNSFLDAVILDVLFENPVWSLARGDAFMGKQINRLLYQLKMLPVYRPSEGVENLSENYKTFEACIDIFRKNGIVLIFSEGLCENEWHLRPLKKGTARLAVKCQDENIPLKILPVGINYSSFRKFGKNIFINFGQLFTTAAMDAHAAEGIRNQAFNSRLQQELEPLVFEIEKTDKQKQMALLQIKIPFYKKVLLAIPAALGWLIHAPLYLTAKKITLHKLRDTVHVDSVLIALLIFTYPLYMLLIVWLLWLLFKSYWVFSLFLLLPFFAWCYVALKDQLDE